MAAITNPGIYTLPELFDFDSIDEKIARVLGHKLFGDETILLTCVKPVGKQAVSITIWQEIDTITLEALDETYTKKGLAPNPWHLIAFAKMQPDFADVRAILTQWKVADDDFRYAYFQRRENGDREFEVGQLKYGCDEFFLLSGSDKESLGPSL